MKLKSVVLYLLLAPAVVFLSQGCDKCDQTGTITFDAAQQFFEVTYIEDTSGKNFATEIWNPGNVSIVFDEDGGKGNFVNLSDDLSDGKIGPHAFTTSPQMAKKGIYHHYMYIVTKDTFGIDTFEVIFLPAVDECREYWSLVEFYRNGDVIGNCTGKEKCQIEIRE